MNTMVLQSESRRARPAALPSLKQAHRLHTTAGELAYAKLVLALGADPIRLELSGDGAGEVLSVNDLSDYARFRQRIAQARRIAILGAGLIGCEFANDLAGAVTKWM